MTRRNFQLLVVVWQLLTLGIVAIDYLTESHLSVVLNADASRSVLDADNYSLIENALDAVYWTNTIVGILAAVGLVLFRTWGRVALLLYVILLLISTTISGPYLTTGWTSAVMYAASVGDGILLAVVYFSPIRKMFNVHTGRLNGG